MELTKVTKHAKKLLSDLRGSDPDWSKLSTTAQARQLLEDYAPGGRQSQFYNLASKGVGGGEEWEVHTAAQALDGFLAYVKSDLLGGTSLKRQAETEVVSNVLEQAAAIVDDTGFHPATAVMLAGAALEQYLRSWAEDLKLAFEGNKRTVEVYANVLAKAGKLDKGERKRVLAWGDQRNDAAHGNFDKASDRQLAKTMVEGIDLFMQRHNR